MKYFLQVMLLALVSNFSCIKAQHIDSVIVAFYNVENLFDTLNNPNTNDEDYLPYGIHAWNSKRYNKKILNTSRALSAFNNWAGADIVGLCEVENREVLKDLLETLALKNKGYEILHKQSPDGRGIDVCALYKPSKIELIDYSFISVDLPQSSRTTRDILYFKGKTFTEDTLHIFYNHWPSRYGGEAVSVAKRLYVSEIVQQKVDSLLRLNPLSKVVVMGDFNDGPTNQSILDLAQVGLLNLELNNNLPGTHKYQSEWNTFDQCLISLSIKNYEAEVFSPEWLLMKDEKYSGQKPFRTFNGPNYLGGYSDHLGLVLKVFSVD